MKIGLVLEKFDPQRGGLEQWSWQFAQSLSGLGHEVHVITFEYAQCPTAPPLIMHHVEQSGSPLGRAALLEQKLRRLELDVVHDMGCGWSADIFHPHGGSTLALWEHNLKRIPRWRQIRFWREKRYRELEEIEKRQHTCGDSTVIAVSDMVRNHFRELHGLPEERMRLIYNGVDVERFSPRRRQALRDPMRSKLEIASEETVFLMVAHNLLLKNAEASIRALAGMVGAGEKARLLIVGGRRPRQFAKLAQRLGVRRLVDFVEPVEDVLPYYASADVYLHPTWYDPCSLVTLEALACGLPVITSRFNGASEMITDGKEGFILDDPKDIVALVSRMQLLTSAGLRRQMGEAGCILAAEHTFERQTEEFLTLYQELVKRRRKVLT